MIHSQIILKLSRRMTTTSSISRKASSSNYFDLLHPKWTDECFIPWTKDRDMLQQLLYRNNHQHRPTLIYRFVKRMFRESQLFSNEERWKVLKLSLIESNAITSSSKITTNISQKLIAQRQILITYICETSKVINCIVKAGRAAVQGLQRRTFATLYSTWIAFVGSFYQFFKHILIQTLLPALSSTDEKIKIAASISKQSSSLISSLNHSFCPVVQHILNRLQLDTTIDTLVNNNEHSAKCDEIVVDTSPNLVLAEDHNALKEEVTLEETEQSAEEGPRSIAEDVGAPHTKKRPLGKEESSDVSQTARKKIRQSGEEVVERVVNNNDEDSIEDIFAASSSSSKITKKTKKKDSKKTKTIKDRDNKAADFLSSMNDGDDIDNIFFSFSKSLSK